MLTEQKGDDGRTIIGKLDDIELDLEAEAAAGGEAWAVPCLHLVGVLRAQIAASAS